ncbi:unnamed protein product [Paramecium pentaurelia]|uniref:Uncharacterized protein n=1 Tax=Paramecium pentaurelia TaxID=43138 RepID=A0A8S1VWZ4_9CILI|nr:unnamed protein product [Paramecium pentaurelia]
MNINQDNQILYYQDGEAIRMQEEFRPNQTQQDVLKNLEQLKFLFQHGKYGQYGKKTGYWYVSWNGSVLNSIGGYYEEGQKHGRWNQLFKNYHNSNKIYEIGEYCYNRKIGYWKYMLNDNLIGGEQYDDGGHEFQVGKWIEFDDGYNQQKQVMYDGEYINGKKVDIQNKIYGGVRAYDLGVRNGYFIELIDGFKFQSQVIYYGVYQNWKRAGRWFIQYKDISMYGNYEKMQLQIIIKYHKFSGGGLYDQEGQGLKMGNWIDFSDEYKWNSQVIYVGGYIHGKKVGRWEIQFRKSDEREFKKIGVGKYDEVGQEEKIGQWINIDGNYSDDSQVTYHGEYKNGKKVGRWDFWFNYNDLERGRKHIICKFLQLTQNGEYQQGKKVGRWDISYKEETDNWGIFYMNLDFQNIVFKNNRIKKENKLIGGGQYDKQNQGFKVGLWIDLGDQFKKYEQVLCKGEYINGKKVGVCKVLKKDQNENDEEFKLEKSNLT